MGDLAMELSTPTWKKSGRKCEGMWKKSGTKSWESETRCIIVRVRPGAERSAIKSVGLSDAMCVKKRCNVCAI